MSDAKEHQQKRRKRGYSLRSQLFFKNAEKPSGLNDLENSAATPPPQTSQPERNDIELSNIVTNDNTTPTSDDSEYPNTTIKTITRDESFDDIPRVRHGPISKTYAGKRGNFQSKLVDAKNFLLNIRPYKKSIDGRKMPVSLIKDFDTDVFPTVIDKDQELLVDDRYSKPYLDNRISSSRYSLYSFLPKQLYAQFSKIANIYFMTVSILQMIPSWSTTGTYTTIIPLLLFITISMLREGYDDWRRHLQDKKENNSFTNVVIANDEPVKHADDLYAVSRITSQSSVSQLYTGESDEEIDDSLLNEPNTFTKENFLKHIGVQIVKTKWKHIKVGDFIRPQQDEPVPADIILLTSDGDNENEVFVETMDLDGETNLKSRLPHQKISSVMNSANGLKNFQASVTIEDPNPDLYNFEGNVKIGENTYPLGPENVIYRGSIIRNSKNLIGLVIFTGEETKIRMNAIRNPRTKAPKLQKAINIIVAFMVLVVLCLSLFSFMGQRLYMTRYWDRAWYLYNEEAGIAPTIMSFIIMYNTLIPLSLYVTTEIIKLVQMLLLHWDIDMYHKPSDTPCEARTATILEELGQVSYVFSDKTGTLTDNLMIFRKFSVAGTAWAHSFEDDDDGTNSDESLKLDKAETNDTHSRYRNSIDIRRSTTRYSGRPSMASAISSQRHLARSTTQKSTNNKHQDSDEIKSAIELLRHIQENPNTLFSKKAKFFILALSLCHTCLPKIISEDNEEVEYQSSSPDELALVVAARDLGYVVYQKSHRHLTIRTYPNGTDVDPVDEVYEILNVVDFSSSRKRMSVIVKFPNDRICLICKGADNVILERLKDVGLANKKREEIHQSSSLRKAQEAQLVIQQRQSLDYSLSPRKSIQLARASMGANSIDTNANTIDDIVQNNKRETNEVDDLVYESRKSLHLQQQRKYNIKDTEDYIGSDKLVLNDEYVLEKTLQHIDEFSTEGLRTLLYGYKWLDKTEYDNWALEYASAKTSLTNRSQRIEEVGTLLESQFELLGATAIEDKLQDGVADTIEKLRRAGIKLWMLTGDKKETAINIGYSCKLIKDYSTLVILDSRDEDITAKMTAAELELDSGNVAHCVVVIDGATLGDFEADSSILSIFISLCTRTDSVICCRASPSQKAMMVSSIRKLKKDLVTLAIGDGANDIAMIQNADIGIGITGKEGLQAARSSDYSIAQFKYLQKLLLVHGRYNYIRTSKFVLSTFYKELLFYLTQVIYQRNTMFTGTSLYEQWSLSMFNTLFTSLPVLCIGMFEKDLKPATLLAVPELYAKGRLSEGFNLRIFIGWMVVATATSLLISFTSWYLWGFYATYDNSLYPMGVLIYTAIVFTINIKVQFLEQHDRTYLNFASCLISCLGWLLWCCILPGLYNDDTSKIYDVYRGIYWKFGKDITWWATLLIIVTMPILLDYIIQVFRYWMLPTDVDEFQILEKRTSVRRDLEREAFDQMQQGWKWDKDESTIKRYINRKRQNTITLDTELPPGSPSIVETATSVYNDGEYETEILPSGKLIKRRLKDTTTQKLGKKLRFARDTNRDEDVDAIIEQRMRDLE